MLNSILPCNWEIFISPGKGCGLHILSGNGVGGSFRTDPAEKDGLHIFELPGSLLEFKRYSHH